MVHHCNPLYRLLCSSSQNTVRNDEILMKCNNSNGSCCHHLGRSGMRNLETNKMSSILVTDKTRSRDVLANCDISQNLLIFITLIFPTVSRLVFTNTVMSNISPPVVQRRPRHRAVFLLSPPWEFPSVVGTSWRLPHSDWSYCWSWRSR